MPTYDYQCRACGAVTEVIHSMLEPGPSTCERCGGELRRVLYPTGIIFKGSGFYRNDSRATAEKSGTTGTDSSKPDSSSGGAGAGAAPKPAGGADGSSGSSSEAKGTSSEAP